MSNRSSRKLLTGLVGITTTLMVVAGCVPDPVTPPQPVSDVRFNEIESNGGTPGDWVELINLGPDAADLSGATFRDNDDTHSYVLPTGTTLAVGAYLVLDEAQFGFGLGGADSARLFATDGSEVASYSWATHAAVTHGRCPDGTGDFAANAVSTKGAANNCAPAPVTTVHVNEVESNGGTPGDWVELINTGSTPVDISGWSVLDNDDTHTRVPFATGTTIAAGGYLVVEEATFGFGLGGADSVRLFDASGAVYETYSWTAHASSTYGRCPNGTGAFTSTTSTKGAPNDCGNPVKINEVESSGGTPGDWVELFNPSTSPIDISGLTISDNDDTHDYVIPATTVLAGGGYFVIEEAALGFGLGGADSVRFFDAAGGVIDTYTWAAHSTMTYGRCPNGTGAFATTTVATKGALNACVGDVITAAWPGGDAVQTADGTGAFGGNVSGLVYEGSGTSAPGVLWAVKNGPGTLYRVVSDGTTWAPEPTGDWGSGKTLRFADGTGNPDAEGVTFAGAGSTEGIFVSTERNNDVSGASRNRILRFDPNAAGTTLNATNEWDLTADLPVVGANLGLEAITWVPDSALVAKGFVDQATGAPYSPATYANHGTGLFFVGVEANGAVYAYALDLTGSGFTRVATIASGFAGVMDLSFDRDQGDFWAICDDGCLGRSTVLTVNAAGAYVPGTVFERPATMPNLNNEGFAIASATECAAGRRPVFWADDSATSGHAIRTGTVNCTL